MMFFGRYKDLTRRLVEAEEAASNLKDKFWELQRRHYALLRHLGLEEQTVYQHTKLVDAPSKNTSA